MIRLVGTASPLPSSTVQPLQGHGDNSLADLQWGLAALTEGPATALSPSLIDKIFFEEFLDFGDQCLRNSADWGVGEPHRRIECEALHFRGVLCRVIVNDHGPPRLADQIDARNIPPLKNEIDGLTNNTNRNLGVNDRTVGVGWLIHFGGVCRLPIARQIHEVRKRSNQN